MMQEVEESTATLLPEAEQVLMELEEEARANWEERAIYQATQVTNLASEAFKTLSENRWSRRDCTEYQEELDWAMRTFRWVCGEVDTASMPAKMRRMARARLDRVNSEFQRATRVVERLLQAHGGRQEERRPPAGGGYREEQKYRDDFGIGRAPDQRMEYEDSIPMERRPTLPVTKILEAGAVLGKCNGARKVGPPQRSRQRPRARRPWHGWAEHRRAHAPSDDRRGCEARNRGQRGSEAHRWRGGRSIGPQDADQQPGQAGDLVQRVPGKEGQRKGLPCPHHQRRAGHQGQLHHGGHERG